MENEYGLVLNQVKDKVNTLFKAIDKKDNEIKILTEENNKLKTELLKQKEGIEKLKTTKIENEFNQITENLGKNEKIELTKDIDDIIRVIDKSITLLSK